MKEEGHDCSESCAIAELEICCLLKNFQKLVLQCPSCAIEFVYTSEKLIEHEERC